MTGFAQGMGNKKILLISFVLIAGIATATLAKSGYYFIRGLVAFRAGFEGESVKYLEKSIKANPNFIESYMLLALAYAEWGSSSMQYIEHDKAGLAEIKSETFGRAEDVLKIALKRFPNHYLKNNMQYMLGRLYDNNSRSPK